MKISIIMQSYLGDYPGSRAHPEMKFIRAVYSVIGQTDPDWELIIVSDGCEITKRLYEEHFSNLENIKFFMVEKPENTKMTVFNNSSEENKAYFRGKPRAVGVENATGDWICYLDTDDFYTNNAVKDLKYHIGEGIKQKKDLRYILTNVVIENSRILKHVDLNSKEPIKLTQTSEVKKISGLPESWVSMSITNQEEKDLLPTGTCSIIHKNGYPSWKWGDTSGTEGDEKGGEDNLFIRPMIRQEGSYCLVGRIHYYVRCNHKMWDL